MGLSLLSGNYDVAIFTYLFKIVTFQGIDSLWFIPCYFASELLLVIGNLSKNTKRFLFVICVCMAVYLAVATNYPSFWLLRLMIKIIVCFSFMFVGFLLGSYRDIFEIPVPFSYLLVVGGEQ